MLNHRIFIFANISDLWSHKIHWEDSRHEGLQMKYNGVPFVIVGWDIRECQFGPDRNIKKKEKYQNKRVNFMKCCIILFI